jgi:hypothetical protein
MWTALVRQLAVFLFTKRGKRIAAFAAVVLLCFLTALLTDSKMYLSAIVTGAVTVMMVIALIAQYFRQRFKQRSRARRDAEQAQKRTAAAQARSERFDKAKSAFSGAARTASGSAAGVAGLAKTGFGGARDRLRFWRRKKKSLVPLVDGRDKYDRMAGRGQQ